MERATRQARCSFSTFNTRYVYCVEIAMGYVFQKCKEATSAIITTVNYDTPD
jgi:hypothetical protein